MTSLDELGLMWVPLDAILEYCDPTIDNPWGCGPINVDDVHRAARMGHLRDEPTTSPEELEDYSYNVERIAYLLHRFDGEPELDPHPIGFDVGLVGYTPAYMLYDGNHRVAAAKILGTEEVLVSIGGDWEKAKAVLLRGVHPDEYSG